MSSIKIEKSDTEENNTGSHPNESKAKNREFTTTLILALISIYQRGISPIFPASCRFRPTCSQYAVEVIREFGAAEGLFLAIARVLRCHPFQPGGYDPPPTKIWNKSPSK